MRLLFYILAVTALLAGILFGALNADTARVDLYFVQFDLMLGVALLLAMLLGALLAWLLLSLGVIWPLRRRLARERKEARRVIAAADQGNSAQVVGTSAIAESSGA
ncbi:MAG: lipopolysaccharide assembly protein LapA domain-containing protein [Lysobacteraceae bacterium]